MTSTVLTGFPSPPVFDIPRLTAFDTAATVPFVKQTTHNVFLSAPDIRAAFQSVDIHVNYENHVISDCLFLHNRQAILLRKCLDWKYSPWIFDAAENR